MRYVWIILAWMWTFSVDAIAATPVRIGLTMSLTGKYAELGDMQMKGYRLWERDVNSKGGLLGRPVQLKIVDDKSDPEFANSLYKGFINDDKVDLVFGPYSSELNRAIVPVTEKHGYPVLTGGAGADALWQQGYRYLFGVLNHVSAYTVGFLELLAANNVHAIALINADDLTSKELSKGTQEWAKRFHMNITFTEEFKKGTRDLDQVIRRAQASKAQVLMVFGHFDEAVNARTALKRLGWMPRAYYASIGPLVPKYYETLKSDADGTFSSSQWEPNSHFPGTDEFVERFKTAYQVMPSYQAAAGYASGQILEAAVKKANSINREKLREVLASLDTISIVGRYGVDDTGKQIRQFSLIVQWQGGKKQIVAPEQVATARPIWK